MKTEFKKLENLVIEINSAPDIYVKGTDAQISPTMDYFYSLMDEKVHKSTSWSQYYYYDEIRGKHPQGKVHKVLATSNKSMYPEHPLLTVMDLVRGQ